MSQTPTHNIAQPFEYDAIERVAKSLLQRDRFDRDRLPSDDDDMSDEDDDDDGFSDSDDSSSSSEDSDDQEDSEEEYAKKKKKAKERRVRPKEKKRKKVRFKDSEADDTDEELQQLYHKSKSRKKSKSSQGKDAGSEVEELITQLNRMSISDPAYATTYFRACRLDPLVQQIVPSPLSGKARSNASPQDDSRGGRETPPHFGRRPYDPQRQPCWGCGETGHGTYSCPRMYDLEQKQIVKKIGRGRWAMSDGSPIFRSYPDEPLASAVARQQSPQANYITLHSAYIETDDEEEAFMNEFYPVRPDNTYYYEFPLDSGEETDYEVLAADRPERIS